MPDIVTTQIFSDGEKGITATKLNNVVSQSVIQPDFVLNKPTSATLDPTDQLLEVKGAGTYARITGAQLSSSVAGQLPLADATQNGMLRKVSGLTTDFVDGTNNCQNLASAPGITLMRLRSINALGNPNFEVDQINVGTVVANPATGTKIQDRWLYQKAGTLVASAGQISAAAGDVLVPGTNFAITSKFHRITLTTAQASLGANDNLTLLAQLEGPSFRELQYDVHSPSLLVRSSVAGLKFGLSIRDPATTTKSLVKLCTITSAATWTLIQLPNLPVFPSGNFSTAQGVLGYLLSICLAAGTTLTAAANDTWQNGNFIGAVGQDNFASKATSSTFDIAYVSHEPGAVCTTLIDKPFQQNYDECLRYFSKSYDYGTKPGTVTNNGLFTLMINTGVSATAASGYVPFPKPMAKVPTSLLLYNHATGASQSIRDHAGTDHAITGQAGLGERGFAQLTYSTVAASSGWVYGHYSADTGW